MNETPIVMADASHGTTATENTNSQVDNNTAGTTADNTLLALAEFQKMDSGGTTEPPKPREFTETDLEIMEKERAAQVKTEPTVETQESKEEPKAEVVTETVEEEEDLENEDIEAKPKPHNFRINVKGRDPVDALAIELLKQNRNLSVVEADRMAREKLGVVAETQVETKEPEVEKPSEFDAQIEEIEKIIAEAKEAKKKAIADYDNEAIEAATDKLVELHAEKTRIKLEKSQEAKQKQYEKQYALDKEAYEFQEKAKKDYPELTDEKSPLRVRINELDKKLKADKNPAIYNTNYALWIAQVAANQLNLLPHSLRTSPVVPAESKKTNKPVVQPSVGQRTIQQTPPKISDLVKPGETSGEAFRALMRQQGFNYAD